MADALEADREALVELADRETALGRPRLPGELTRTVYQLMNDNLPPGCAEGGCTVAGFSENLHVYAMATDGWSRQSQYDDGDVRAFVLAPTA